MTVMILSLFTDTHSWPACNVKPVFASLIQKIELICFIVLIHRGGISEWTGSVGPLPGRRVPFCDHRHRLPYEAHPHDNDRCLQIRAEPSSSGVPESKLHGPAIGVREGPQLRGDSSYPDA